MRRGQITHFFWGLFWVSLYGGDTLFASGTAAYSALDPAMKKKLEGLKAVNFYVYNSVKRNDEQGVDATSQAVHPIVRTTRKPSARRSTLIG